MTRDDRLVDLLMAWDDARAAGRPVTPERLCEETPTLLPEFTRLLRQLGRVDPVFDGVAVATGGRIEPIDAGRYDPLSLHAEGGLGVIFLAEDTELKRPVALKWMKPLAGLDPAARRQFLREAEITGKLEHPGIAPVYGAGHDPAGRPFYAMRFIHGTTLGECVGRFHGRPAANRFRSDEFTRLLRAVVSVCQTVAYAHARGVIHRDLKPGNVMLGPFGETLVVDWGLAKRVDAPADEGVPVAPLRLDLGGGDETVAGAVKGSPAYMAPEQARGETAGPPADVYALGATLYAVLTGRPPYAGNSALEVLDQVLRGPPPSPRERDTAVPGPLSAVCMKAMSREPADRYASPLDLAADLDRWLADKPVSAYRDPLPTRLRRWAGRHRTPVGMALAAVLVVAVALAVVVPLLTAKNRELTRQKDELEKAYGELERSNAAQRDDFEDADTSVRGLIEVVFARAITEPGKPTAALRGEAVRRYHGYLRRFIERNTHRAEVRAEVAAAWLKLAELDGILDPKSEAAATDLTTAERLFGELRAERPDDREVLYGWALAAAQHGELSADHGRWADALKRFGAARLAFERLAADPAPVRLVAMFSVPGVLENTPAFQLANVLFSASEVRRRAGQFKDAVPGAASWNWPTRRRDDLRAAVRLLTDDRPLPADAPLFTRLKALAVRVELAAAEEDPNKAVAAFTALQKELTPLAEPATAGEFKALLMETHIGLGKAEAGVARRKYEDALARGDATAAVEAVKAFDAALLRLDQAVGTSYTLRQSDLGLDPFDLRARALTAPLEISLAELQAVSGMGREDWRYVDRALTHLQILADTKDLPRPAAVRGLMAAGEFVQVLGLTGYKKHLEQACQLGIQLLDRLLADAPDEPALVLLKANLYAGTAAARLGMRNWPVDEPGRAKMVQSVRDALDTSERLLSAIPRDPTDWGPVVVELQLLTVRAGLDDGRAVACCEAMLAKLTEGEKLGMPAELVTVTRFTGEVMLIAALAGEAERHLDATPTDPAAARPLIARAVKMSHDLLERPVTDEPSTAAAMGYLRKRLTQFGPELEKLEVRAKGQ